MERSCLLRHFLMAHTLHSTAYWENTYRGSSKYRNSMTLTGQPASKINCELYDFQVVYHVIFNIASTSLPSNTNAPIWSMSIAIHGKFLLGRLLLSVISLISLYTMICKWKQSADNIVTFSGFSNTGNAAIT